MRVALRAEAAVVKGSMVEVVAAAVNVVVETALMEEVKDELARAVTRGEKDVVTSEAAVVEFIEPIAAVVRSVGVIMLAGVIPAGVMMPAVEVMGGGGMVVTALAPFCSAKSRS